MNDLRKKLLNRIQSGFPIVSRPYLALADEFGCSEADLIAEVRKLKEEGVIRRLGAAFASHKLGYSSTLVAMKAPQGRVDEVAAVINEYPNVTHNYLREHEYNIWFTLITPEKDDIERILKEISRKTGITEIKDLPASRLFKIRVQFKV